MESPLGSDRFTTTHWTVVNQAKAGDSVDRRDALGTLCQRYWPPIYAFIRRRGHKLEDAQDLTQEFFFRLIQKDYLSAADASKGRFRTLLLTAVSRFLVNEWERSQTQKRGGNVIHLSLDDCLTQEERWKEPSNDNTAERIFERRWAEATLQTVIENLKSDMEKEGLAERFELLKPFLVTDRPPASTAELAGILGVAEGTIYSLIHRLRKRYGQLLREEIEQTVGSPEEIQDELRCLLAALSA